MSDRKKPKKPWREVDTARQRSGHRRTTRPGSDPYAQRGNKSYRAELDRFFDKGEASDRIQTLMKDAKAPPDAVAAEPPEKVRLIRKIRQAGTFDEFVKAVDTVRGDYHLPDDADILTRVLEHPDNAAIIDALERLAGMSGRLDIPDIKAINLRLVTLETATDDPKVQALVEALRAKI